MNTEQALLALVSALVLVPVGALTLACLLALARMRGKVQLDLHLDPEQGRGMTSETGERNRLRNSVTVTPPNPDAKVTASLYGGPEIPVKQETEVPDSVVAALEARGLKVERN